MIDWVKDHTEWLLGALGTVGAATAGYWIKLVRKVNHSFEQVQHLEGALGQHTAEDQKAHEDIVGLKFEVRTMKEDLLENREGLKALAAEFRKEREDNREQFKQLMGIINENFKALRDELARGRLGRR